MNYIEIGKIPPNSKNELSTPEQLVENLKSLIGEKFPLTGKPRTDGSNFRKMITNHLLSNYIPKEAVEYEIVPPKQKGVPSFLREYIDTYIVTSGVNYNLQVWNRNPNSSSVQVDLKNGETLLASDVRFVLGKINADEIIESIVIMTPEYIENRFGKFGKPTVKQQLIISNKKREEILKKHSMIVADTNISVDLLDTENNMVVGDVNIKDEPERVLPIETINQQVNSILDINSEKTDAILELKREISDYNKKIRAQRTKLIPLQENISGSRIISKDDLSMLKKFFPEIEIKRLEEIQNFHKEISAVLKEEIKEEISSVQNVIQLLEGNKAQVEQKVKEISEMSNLSQVILFKFAELQKKIEILSNQNKYYDELQVLSKEKKDADSRKQMMRMQQLSQLQNWINIKLQQLNDEIYHATKRPPIIMFDNKQYKFETIDDTGTGTCYRGMVLFDLAVLQDTCLPILVHDSVLLKQIEDVAIEKILDMYKDSKKQIFISLDKATSYSKKSQQILFDKKVLCLGPNGRELFGQSWSRK